MKILPVKHDTFTDNVPIQEAGAMSYFKKELARRQVKPTAGAGFSSPMIS